MLAVSAASKAAMPTLSLPRGGGWLAEVTKDVDSSVATAKKIALNAYDSASAKASDAAKNAKEKADQVWIKKVDELEKKVLDERAKASEKLAAQQKRLMEQAEKEKRRLQSKIDYLEKKISEEVKK
jgi:hypothetical protein